MENKFDLSGRASEAGFLGENQLLERIPFCRRTLSGLRAAGKIPFIRLGGRRILYHWPSVQAALLRYQRGGPEFLFGHALESGRSHAIDSSSPMIHRQPRRNPLSNIAVS